MQGGLQTEEELKEFEIKKDGVLRKADELLKQNKRVCNQPEPVLDILGDTNQLERDFFEQ